MKLSVGDELPLNLQLWDGNVSKYVRAFLYDQDENSLGNYDLEHLAHGKYIRDKDSPVLMPNVDTVHATYIAYDDPAYTIVSGDHGYATDVWKRKGADEVMIKEAVLVGKIVENPVLIGTVIESDIVGELVSDSVVGTVSEDVLVGTVEESDVIGSVNEESVTGKIEDC